MNLAEEVFKGIKGWKCPWSTWYLVSGCDL